MKKFYNFLLLAMMFITGTLSVQAEKRYHVEGENIASGLSWDLTSVEAGKQFVMQSGSQLGGSNDFVRGLGKSSGITDENLFVLEENGQTDEGETIYLLKRVVNNEYLAADGYSFNATKARAWSFIVVEPVEYSEDNFNAVGEDCPIADWRSATKVSGGMGAQLIFVDASNVADTTVTTKNNVKFLCSGGLGAAPYFGNGFGENTWELYSVEEIYGAEYMQDALDEIFPGGDPAIYQPGNDPGQIPQEYYDELINSYNAANALIEQGVGEEAQAECEAAAERCKKAVKEAKEHFIRVKEGFYFFHNWRSATHATYDDGETLHYITDFERPEQLDLKNAKYVWHLTENKEIPGTYFIQNYYTKRWVAAPEGLYKAMKSTDDPKEAESYWIEPQNADPSFFYMLADSQKDDKRGLHEQEAGQIIVIWDYQAEASGWKFLDIPAEQVEALNDQIEQAVMNEKLQKLYDQADADYKKGFCFFDGNNNGALEMNEDGTAAGLVNTIDQISTNRQEASEGPLEAILDNKIERGNFFHSDWQRKANPEQLPFLQINLKEAVDHVIVKMWARWNGNNLMVNNLPGLVNVWATNTPDDSTSWKRISQIKTEIPWNYPEVNDAGEFTGKFYDALAVGKLDADLKDKYQYIRLENERMYANMNSTAAVDTANTFFNMCEIRLFKYEYIAEKSMIEAVDPVVRKKFEDKKKEVEAALEAGTATQQLYDEFEAAYKEFLDNYPDPQIVVRALAEAKAQSEAAVEGDGLGYFKEGAKEALNAAIASVESQVKEIMTLAEVQAAKAELDAAMKAFNDKLIKPEAGKLYYVKSETTSDQANSAGQAYVYAPGNGTRIKWMQNSELDLSTLPQLVWKFEVKENGYALKNVLTGEYLGNPKKNNVGVFAAAADTCAFELRSAKEGGMFNLVMEENVFMNAQPGTDRNIVTWGEANGADNSAFSFTEVADDEFSGSIQWNDITPNGVQIITLPVTVNVAAEDGCYSVIGRNGNNLELKAIEGDIVAGTPFFFQETAGDNFFQFFSKAELFTGLAETQAKEAIEVNGLVGTLNKIDSLHVGYGILYNGSIIESTVGEGVANNSGYIAPTVKATTETGDLQVAIEGNITAIEDVINTTSVASDVYSLSGIKVRANVKSMNDLNGLPAGIYIMGNKKVLVK